MTALIWAAVNDRTGVVMVLIDAGADVNAKGRVLTALMFAELYRHTRTAQVLREAGAVMSAKDQEIMRDIRRGRHMR